MLQDTAARIETIVAPDRIFVITNASHVARIKEQIPQIPDKNIVGEPAGRDSAPAIGLMAAIIERELGNDTVMVVLPADHVIQNESAFRQVILLAAKSAEDGYLVTVGIPPTGPETGFGYIHHGERIGEDSGSALVVERVAKFHEKPDRATAERYLADGNYYWNAGIYVVTVGILRTLYRTHLPSYEPTFSALARTYGTSEWNATLSEIFPLVDKKSFDYGIAEKAERVAVVPADMGWNDIGSWSRLADVIGATDGQGNAVVGPHVAIETVNSLIYGRDRLVVTFGLDGIVVVDTPDVVFVCPMNRSEEIKKVIEALSEQGHNELL